MQPEGFCAFRWSISTTQEELGTCTELLMKALTGKALWISDSSTFRNIRYAVTSHARVALCIAAVSWTQIWCLSGRL